MPLACTMEANLMLGNNYVPILEKHDRICIYTFLLPSRYILIGASDVRCLKPFALISSSYVYGVIFGGSQRSFSPPVVSLTETSRSNSV